MGRFRKMRPAGRMASRMVRRHAARQIRRHLAQRPRRRVMRRGGGALFMLGAVALKLAMDDVDRMEQDLGKPAEEMTDAEILAAMERLGISKQDLDEDDEAETKRAPRVPTECDSCGFGLTTENIDWAGPTSAQCPMCGTGVEVEWVTIG
ncbi:MAG: hypothetical protein GYB64_09550 [Chloroflexi bacterium]|nr:hypothetical protein [Chloroflexota bacterium]